MSAAKVQNKIRITYACPKCSGELSRISKRSVDKLVNMLVPVRRFKCYSCLWEGTQFSPKNG